MGRITILLVLFLAATVLRTMILWRRRWLDSEAEPKPSADREASVRMARNVDHIRAFVARGAVAGAEVLLVHRFYAFDRGAADRMAEDVREAGFETIPGEPARHGGRMVHVFDAVRSCPLAAAPVHRVTERLATIARRHRGVYDGWTLPAD